MKKPLRIERIYIISLHDKIFFTIFFVLALAFIYFTLTPVCPTLHFV